jgi:hypothetical protein
MDDSEMIARHRQHALDLDALLRRVEARGGPAAPWQVDLDRGLATLGSLTVSFYKLRNRGFAPQSYRRSDDQEADQRRDWLLIEDACACIARKLTERGVPMRTQVNFCPPTLKDCSLTLWGVGSGDVARIDCQALRKGWRLGDQVTDEQCRMVALSNLVLLGDVAGDMADAGRFDVGTAGLRIFNIGHEELHAVESDVSRSILNQPPVMWITR